jgi:hypothetical protein
MLLFLGSRLEAIDVFDVFELSEYHFLFLVGASLRVVALETVEWMDDASDMVLDDVLEDIFEWG